MSTRAQIVLEIIAGEFDRLTPPCMEELADAALYEFVVLREENARYRKALERIKRENTKSETERGYWAVIADAALTRVK